MQTIFDIWIVFYLRFAQFFLQFATHCTTFVVRQLADRLHIRYLCSNIICPRHHSDILRPATVVLKLLLGLCVAIIAPSHVLSKAFLKLFTKLKALVAKDSNLITVFGILIWLTCSDNC